MVDDVLLNKSASIERCLARELDLAILRSIVEHRLDDFRRYTAALLRNPL